MDATDTGTLVLQANGGARLAGRMPSAAGLGRVGIGVMWVLITVVTWLTLLGATFGTDTLAPEALRSPITWSAEPRPLQDATVRVLQAPGREPAPEAGIAHP
jgi:hypothetical protein